MWAKLLSKKRYYENNKLQEDNQEAFFRSSFHKDYDRVIFSNSFRRLSNKTQVHPLTKNDHVHNRMTHSLEVASVGRSLGLNAGKLLKDKGFDVEPNDVAYIVQTACLAHDIGNPPFGHAGEEVIKEWFKKNGDETFLAELSDEEKADFQNIDGNAQSLRIVSQLENNFLNGGMRLTIATLGTLVKYPYSSSHEKANEKQKFNFFQSEKELFDLMFSELGLKSTGGVYRRHPLSYLMEASDDICYGLLDLQDAFELEIVNFEDARKIFSLLCGEAIALEIYEDVNMSKINKVSKLVATSINNLALHVMEVFEENYDDIVDGQQPNELIELFSKDEFSRGMKELKTLAREKIFNEKRKIELELGAYNIIETLLDNFIRAVYHQEKSGKLSFRDKRVLELMGENKPVESDSLYNKYQRVVDYIVGMTDNNAKYVAHQFNGMSY